MKFDCIIQKPAEPAAGLPAITDRVTVAVESGEPGGKPGEFAQHIAHALSEWYDGAEVHWLPYDKLDLGRAKTLANQVENAQAELYWSLEEALALFTKRTGMMVTGMTWTTTSACDSNGHTDEVGYYDFGSSLATGMS